MAEKGIRRLVELVLDKASTDKVRRNAAEALEKGTDPTKARRNLSSVEGAFGKLKKAAVALGGVLVTVFAVRKIVDFGKAAIRQASEAEAIWNRLGQAVRNAGESFEDARPQVASTARALQDITTVGDEDFASIMTELLTVSNDYQASLQNVSVVADLAAAKQIDLRTAAQLVGRAMIGETGTFTRYGIVIEEGADAVEVLRDRFRGFAENEAKTFQGRLTQLNNEWGDFKQAVGNALIAAGGGTSVLETLTGVVKGMTEWVEKNNEFFEGTAGVLQGVTKAAGFLWEALQRLGELMSGFFFGAMSGLVAGASAGAEALALATSAAAKFLDLIGADGKADRLQNFTETLRTNAQALRNWAVAAGQTSVESFRNTIFGRSAGTSGGGGPRQTGAGSGGTGTGGGGSGGGGGGGGGVGLPNLPGISAPGMGFNLPPIQLDPLPAIESFDAVQDRADEAFQEIGEGAQRMAWAFENGFATVFSGMESLAGAAKGVGLSIVSGLVEGKAEYHFAEAAGKLAEGLWPPNPVALAAAAKHAFAGSLFAAIQGFARSGGRGGPSGSRGGFAGARGSAGAIAGAGAAQPMGPEVHIYFDGPGFNAVNPEVQRIVYNAQQYAQDRFGPNANVKTHRRGR